NLNGQISKILNLYMNKKEKETGKTYTEWTDILDIIRISLNNNRNRKNENPYTYIMPDEIDKIKSKFNIGDLVYPVLERPKNALGHNQNTTSFRQGDIRFDVNNP